MAVRCKLIIDLIFILQIAGEAEHLITHLFVLWFSFSVNCLVISFAYFTLDLGFLIILLHRLLGIYNCLDTNYRNIFFNFLLQFNYILLITFKSSVHLLFIFVHSVK